MNKIVSVSILAVVTIVLTASVLMPVIDEASTEQESSDNRYTFKMSELASGEALELSYSATDSALINGVHPNVSSTSGAVQSELCVISDHAVIVTFGSQWYYYFVDTNGVHHSFNSNNATQSAITAKFENGLLTITSGVNTYTSTYSFVYYPDADGNMAYTRVTNAPHINKDAPIVTFSTGSSSNGVYYGTKDSLTVGYSVVEDFAPTFTTTEAEVEKSTVYSVVQANPEKMIIPLEYTYLVDADTPISDFLYIIPLMVLVALLCAVISVAVRRE